MCSSDLIAVEKDPGRADMVARNAAGLGVPHLDVRLGHAPEVLAGLPAPDAVFIGGGLSTGEMLESCWAALRPRGRLVANTVTLEGETRIVAAAKAFGGSLTRIAISHAEPLAGVHVWRPKRPITQLAAVKP